MIDDRKVFEEQFGVDLTRYQWDGERYVFKYNPTLPAERINTLYQGWRKAVDWCDAQKLRQSQAPAKTWEGCRACYGSGGKKIAPCIVCNGTGKVPKGTQWSQT